MNKFLKTSLILIFLFFIILNIGWFGWRYFKYSSYINDLKENTGISSLLVPRYYKTDADNFNYTLKFPDYLSLTGNLAIGLPGDDKNPFTDCLIIWPNLDGTYEYGVILYDGDESYQIEVNENGEALNKQYDEIIEKHKKNIEKLLYRLKRTWNI